MGDNRFEQILCTHCTFGTSALEVSSAENASHVLGYSVRASSIRDREKLRREFTAIERLLQYQLPGDAQRDFKGKFDAATAPRRLCFIPDFGGRQVAAQVVFRPFDTANRPGSYFAHLLVAPVDAEGTAIDVLRLWGIRNQSELHGWVDTDCEEGFPHLQTLPALKDFAPESRIWLTEDVVRGFLKSGQVRATEALETVVAGRWADVVNDQQRRDILEMMLQAVLEGLHPPTVILAAEPNVVAILFFALLKLLPQSIARKISFSTYESDPFRAASTLVGTTFLQTGTDFRDEEYQSNSLVINTFSAPVFRASTGKSKPGNYVRWVVQKLVAGEQRSVQGLCAAIDLLWKESVPSRDELDRVIELEAFRSALFRQQEAFALRKMTPVLRHFLARRCVDTVIKNIDVLRKSFQGESDASLRLVKQLEQIIRPIPQEWSRIRKNAKCSAWFAETQPTDERHVLQKVSKVERGVSDEEAVHLILSCDTVTKEKRLPHGAASCERLWGHWPQAKSNATFEMPPLLLGVLEEWASDDSNVVLPMPLPPLPVIIGILKAIGQRLSGDVGDTNRKRLEGHVRSVLDQIAGELDEGGVFKDGLNARDFESLLEQMKNFSQYYDPTEGRFQQRVFELIRKGFLRRVGEVCTERRLINLGESWCNSCVDHEDLLRRLRGWKETIIYFSQSAKKGTLPFTSDKKIILENSVKMIIPDGEPNADTKRRKILHSMLDTYEKEKWLRSATKLRKEIDKLFDSR